MGHRLAAVYTKDYPKHFTVQVQSLAEMVVGRFRATLFIVLAAVGLLLLIGCGNVANLLLARATAREKEFAIRAALGAGRWRLVRQLLVESLLLALGGATLGAFMAWGGLKALVAVIPPRIIPAEAVIRLNGTVLAFTLALAVLTAVVFGLVPALQASRRDLVDPLRDSGKGTSGGSAWLSWWPPACSCGASWPSATWTWASRPITSWWPGSPCPTTATRPRSSSPASTGRSWPG